MVPITIGPRLIPKSVIAVNVPITGPGEEPTRSRARTIKEGIRNVYPIPQIIATRINAGRVFEKARMMIEMMEVIRQGKMILSLL